MMPGRASAVWAAERCIRTMAPLWAWPSTWSRMVAAESPCQSFVSTSHSTSYRKPFWPAAAATFAFVAPYGGRNKGTVRRPVAWVKRVVPPPISTSRVDHGTSGEQRVALCVVADLEPPGGDRLGDAGVGGDVASHHEHGGRHVVAAEHVDDGEGARGVEVVVEGEGDLGPVGGSVSDDRRRGSVRAAREGGGQRGEDECGREDGPDRAPPPSRVAGREPMRREVCFRTHGIQDTLSPMSERP